MSEGSRHVFADVLARHYIDWWVAADWSSSYAGNTRKAKTRGARKETLVGKADCDSLYCGIRYIEALDPS